MDYKKLAEAPVSEGFQKGSWKILSVVLRMLCVSLVSVILLLYRGRFVSRCICCIVAGYGLIW